MSKDMILMGDGAALPAHLQQYQEEAKKAAELVTGFNSLPSLSIKGKQFRLTKDDKEVVYPMGQAIEVIILAADPPKGVAKSYYKSAYREGVDELPDCFSSDGIVPDSFSEHKQAISCADCPHNAFGSGTDAAGDPTRGKACGDHKNLFVVEASDVNGAIYVLRVPATSLKDLSRYGRLLSKNGVPTQVLITELTFTDAVHPQLEFNGLRYLSDEEAAITVARSNCDELQMALPSKNKLEAPEREQLPPGEAPKPALPPPPKTKVMTAKANDLSYQSFIDNNWTDAQLIENGYMELK